MTDVVDTDTDKNTDAPGQSIIDGSQDLDERSHASHDSRTSQDKQSRTSQEKPDEAPADPLLGKTIIVQGEPVPVPIPVVVPETKGLSGLTNLGNTCYMNSIIQALSNTTSFMAYLTKKDSILREELRNRVLDRNYAIREKELGKPDENFCMTVGDLIRPAKYTVTTKLGNVFRFLWAINGEIKPVVFKKTIDQYITAFKGYGQADAQEFLSALLDRIDEECKGLCTIKPRMTPEQLDMKSYITTLGSDITTKHNALTALENRRIAIQKKIDELNEEAKTYADEELSVQRDSYDRQMIRVVQQIADIMTAYRALISEINSIFRTKPVDFMRLEAYKAYDRLYKDSYSVINDIFSGLHLSIFTCTECQMISYRFERSDILTLSLYDETYVPDKEYNLEDLIGRYIDVEMLELKNTRYCGYCLKKTPAQKKIHLYSLPDKLVIMIKKYQKVPDDQRFPANLRNTYVKTSSRVHFPFELDMSKFVSEYADTNSSSNSKNTYALYSTVRHSGGLTGGHYYSYAKNHLNNMWYRFDDDRVYWVDDTAEVLKSNGYILFYERV